MTSLSIIDAMDDQELFAPWFPGKSWFAWRIILKGAFALPMTAEEVEFFRTVADRDPPVERVKELWIVAGRRAGKDSIASAIGAHAAALFTDSGQLRPGERALVMCLATDKEQAKVVLNYTRSFFADISLLQGMVERETAQGFELNNKVDVAISTNSFRAVRGRPVLCAIFDEIAFWRDETSASPDEEVYRAIKPAMATMPGSMIIGISSPYRKSGLLYTKFRDHFGKPGNVLVIRAPTTALNPLIDPALIAEALEEDPAAARAEWLAEFRDDIGNWLSAEVIEGALDRGVTVRPPLGRFRYVSFCDPSGGARDSFTAAIAHDEDGSAVLDCLLEIRPPFNPTAATGQIAATLRSYGLTETVGDRYAAEWVVSSFARCGIKYTQSERDRSAIYGDCLPLFTSGRVRLLENKRLVAQFAALERRTSPIGKDRIDHGPGGHDDLCNAAAGALVLTAAADWRESRGLYELYRKQAEVERTTHEPKKIETTYAVGSVEYTKQLRSGKCQFSTA